jgi:hypothetical protein
MQVDEALDQRQAEADTAMLLPAKAARELFKDPFAILSGDTGPGVGYGDRHRIVTVGRGYGDLSARGGVLDRIGNQVEQGLLDAPFIDDQGAEIVVAFQLKRQLTLAGALTRSTSREASRTASVMSRNQILSSLSAPGMAAARRPRDSNTRRPSAVSILSAKAVPSARRRAARSVISLPWSRRSTASTSLKPESESGETVSSCASAPPP